jgi:hypothetical protein
MRTVTVRLPAAGFSAAMADMREWLDRNRFEPTKFKYEQHNEAVALSVDFLNDQERHSPAETSLEPTVVVPRRLRSV